MKVLLINGSPHQKGCTFTALSEISDTFQQEGIDSDIYWIGNKPIGGCIGCFQCAEKQKCVFDDKINEFTKLAAEYDIAEESQALPAGKNAEDTMRELQGFFGAKGRIIDEKIWAYQIQIQDTGMHVGKFYFVK